MSDCCLLCFTCNFAYSVCLTLCICMTIKLFEFEFEFEYIDRDLTLFCYLVHGIPLMKSSKEDGFRFVRSPMNSPHREPATQVYFFCINLDKRLNKRSDCQQFEKIGCSLWRYCNVLPNRRQRCFVQKLRLTLATKNWFPRYEHCWVRCSSFSIKFFFHKHGSCILMTILLYGWLQNDITIIWISNGKTIYTYAENGVSYLFKQ